MRPAATYQQSVAVVTFVDAELPGAVADRGAVSVHQPGEGERKQLLIGALLG